MSGYHVPIMVEEVLRLLEPKRGGVFVDGTLGGGGHSEAILNRLPAGAKLYGIDRDGDAIAESSARLNAMDAAAEFTAIRGNFFDMQRLLRERGVEKADGPLCKPFGGSVGKDRRQLDHQIRAGL